MSKAEEHDGGIKAGSGENVFRSPTALITKGHSGQMTTRPRCPHHRWKAATRSAADAAQTCQLTDNCQFDML